MLAVLATHSVACMPDEDRTDRISHGPNPAYKEIAVDIAADIASGALKKNDKLPGELGLAARYHVARVTIRNAVGLLRKEKVLYAAQGLGTFVSCTPQHAKQLEAKIRKSFAP